MKRLKYAMVCSALFLLIGASFTVAADTITDPTGDVWHYTYTGPAGSWSGSVGDKPNIDITQISTTINGNSVTLSLTVAGTIQSSQKIYYWAYFNTTDTTYFLYLFNGTGYAYATNHSFGYESGNVTISGHTVSAVFSVMGDTSTVQLWGWAAEYTTLGVGQTTNEWWGDWAPNSKIPFSTTPTGNHTGNNTGNNTGGNNSGTKTPGFEVLPLIAAVAIAAVLLRRRR